MFCIDRVINILFDFFFFRRGLIAAFHNMKFTEEHSTHTRAQNEAWSVCVFFYQLAVTNNPDIQ